MKQINKLAIILILFNFICMGTFAQTGNKKADKSLNDTLQVFKTYNDTVKIYNDTVKVYKLHRIMVTASWYHPELGFFKRCFFTLLSGYRSVRVQLFHWGKCIIHPTL